MMKTVLTIAGSDPSGGAGIQADLKTITAHRLYGMSVVTALTAQNTTGVFGIETVDPAFVKQQLDCIFTDIFPDAVKIGMVSSPEIVEVIAERLQYYGAKNIVADPVMVSTSGSKLLSDSAMGVLRTSLLPLGSLITPNIPESEILCGFSVTTEEDMIAAAKKISGDLGCSVLVKGGHMVNDAVDILYYEGTIHRFVSERVQNPNTHGTGCTLSSAIACGLAEGKSLTNSVECAKSYLTNALRSMLDLGKGSGPVDHCWNMNRP